MKIISWNCNMAFRNKAEQIVELKPDLAIILEAEHPDKINFTRQKLAPYQSIWIGDNPNKGVLILSYNSEYDIKIDSSYNPEFRYIIPLIVQRTDYTFTVFAIWTQHTGEIYSSYVVQAYRALKYYEFLINAETIIAGDFNSNSVWDNGDKKEATHTDLVKFLSNKDITSLYHLSSNLSFGKEGSPTLYLQRNREKPYHVDYIFTGSVWTNSTVDFNIGAYDKWISHSDHMPLIAVFDRYNKT